MRLVHCSDLHLLSLEGSRWLDFANKRWIGGLNLLSNRGRHYHTQVFERLIDSVNGLGVDHVLVTGDITNLALEQEFRFARGLFDRFELGPEGVTVIPGNHDAYVSKGAVHFKKYFEPFYRSDDTGAEPWPLVRIRDGVCLVGLSTSLQTPWFTAYGVIGDAQLARVEEALSSEAAADCFKLLAIHHPPAGPPARSRIRGLRDRAKLHRVLAKAGADMVLHGHEHRDLYFELPGPKGSIPVRGIQSSTYEAGNERKRARFRIYDIEGGQVRSEELRVWDPQGETFVVDQTPAISRAS